jgi:hypothetical protein
MATKYAVIAEKSYVNTNSYHVQETLQILAQCWRLVTCKMAVICEQTISEF